MVHTLIDEIRDILTMASLLKTLDVPDTESKIEQQRLIIEGVKLAKARFDDIIKILLEDGL